jgi:FAD/FMN-containing dehydrogenase
MTREISRQAFVRGALGGVVAGALLGSCRSTAPEPPASPSAASPSPPATVSDSQHWSALDEALDGRVVLPSSADYAVAKSVFNARFDDSTPAAVVVVKSVDDVQRAVDFAARNNVKIAARSGGHSYIGASTATSAMVIDLRQLAGEITYDDGSELATISAAGQLDSVQTALAARGRSVPMPGVRA